MAMLNKRFAAFILTHGRPDRVHTYDAIRKAGYTGPIWIVIDDEDTTAPEYREKFGDQVLVFSKAEIAEHFDEADNFYKDRRSIVYARNACFDLARKVGVETFIQLDDDYTTFWYRFDPEGFYGNWPIKSLDAVFDAMVDYHASIPALTIAFSQGGDHLGGGKSGIMSVIQTRRKAMNTFFCRTDRRFYFQGRINEDVNAYTSLAHRGALFLTVLQLMITQLQTQSNAGGMTELYLDSGTFVKTFYTIMFAPSFVKITSMGETHRRIHHKVKWRYGVPMILREELKKGAVDG